MIEHGALINYARAAIEEYEITSKDRILQFASVSYDAHVEELYPCLLQGATLILRDDSMLDSPVAFLRRCEEHRLTVLTLPTGFWHELTLALDSESLQLPEALRLMIIGGEAARPERVATWFEFAGRRVRLLNTYGPTETTVVATSMQLTAQHGQRERIPIGRPLGNMRAYVLDRAQRPVPIGIAG